MTEQLVAALARSPRTRVAGLALLCGLLSYWSRVFFSPSGVGSVLFLPSGVGLAAVLLGGRRFGVSVWIGAFSANLWCGDALLLAFFFASGAALAAVVGAWVIHQSDDFDVQLLSFRNLSHVALGGAWSAVVSTAFGVLTLGLISDLNPANAASVFGLTLISLLAAPWMASSLAGPGALDVSGGEIYFFIFVLVIWSSLRLGPRATSLQVLMVVIAGVQAGATGRARRHAEVVAA